MEKYIDQCPSQLKFYFLEGILDKEQFTVLKSSYLTTNLLTTITACIIGASNVVWIKFSNHAFTEAVICTEDVMLGECKLMNTGNFSTSGKIFGVQNNLFLYKFSGKIYNWDNGIKVINIMERLVKFERKTILGLSKEFEAGQDGIIPKTIVFIKEDSSKRITVCTVHTYPNKKQIALSISKITQTQGG